MAFGLGHLGFLGKMGIPGSLTLSSAAALLVAYGPQGLAIDFAGDQSIAIVDSTTAGNNFQSQGIVSNGSLVGPGAKLTYTSPSPKLCLQSNGFYQYGAHNLVPFSQLGSGWTGAKSATETDNFAAAPDGTTTASRVVSTAAQFYYNNTTSTQSTQVYIGYIWLKSTDGTNQTVGLRINAAATGSNQGTTVVTATSVWQQFSVTFTLAAVDNINWGIDQRNALTGANVACDVLAWGSQVSKYPVNNNYIKTLGSPITALPYEYNTSAVCQGILVEEARTNSFVASATPSTGYTSSNATLTDATTDLLAPNGLNSATKVVATSAAPTVSKTTVGAGSASNNTYSVYCHAGTSATAARRFGVRNNTTATDLVYVDINYTTGALTYIIGASGASSVNVGNGWWRVIITPPSGISAGDNITVYACFTGGATNGDYAYIWQPQLEAGAFATSPIITGSATVTRAVDNIFITTSLFPYSTTNQTWYANFQDTSGGQNKAIIGGSAINTHPLVTSIMTEIDCYYGGTGAFRGSLPNYQNNSIKAASAYSNSTGVTLTGNGAAVVNNGGDTTFAAQTSYGIGSRGGLGTVPMTGYFKQIMYVNVTLSNAQLQTLTT